LPSSGFNGYHTTTINGQGNPTAKDIMQVATDVGLNRKRAESIVEQVMETCKNKPL
jgi:serine/threonine-protein kinase HipA